MLKESNRRRIGTLFQSIYELQLKTATEINLARRVQILTGYKEDSGLYSAGRRYIKILAEGYIYGMSSAKSGRNEQALLRTQKALLALNTNIDHPIIQAIITADKRFFYPPTNYASDLLKLDAQDIVSFLNTKDKKRLEQLLEVNKKIPQLTLPERTLSELIKTLNIAQVQTMRYMAHRLVLPYFNRNIKRQLYPKS